MDESKLVHPWLTMNILYVSIRRSKAKARLIYTSNPTITLISIMVPYTIIGERSKGTTIDMKVTVETKKRNCKESNRYFISRRKEQ